jgi:aspartate kinase
VGFRRTDPIHLEKIGTSCEDENKMSKEPHKSLIDRYFKSQKIGAVDSITVDKNVAKITLAGLKKDGSIISEVFAKLGALGVNVDIIVHDKPEDDLTMKLGFTIEKTELNLAKKAITQLVRDRGYLDVKVLAETGLAKVSVVGLGMKEYPGVAGRTFSALNSHGIEINMISTSEIKISVVIEDGDAEEAMRVLNDTFSEDQFGKK